MPSITRSQTKQLTIAVPKRGNVTTIATPQETMHRKRRRHHQQESTTFTQESVSLKTVLETSSIAHHIASFLDIRAQVKGRIATMRLMPYIVPCHYWIHDSRICHERSMEKHRRFVKADLKQYKAKQVLPPISKLVVAANGEYPWKLLEVIVDMKDPIPYLEWHYKNYSLDTFLSWFLKSFVFRCHIKALQWCEDQIQRSSSSSSSSSAILVWFKAWETHVYWNDRHDQPSNEMIEWLCVKRPTLGKKYLHYSMCLHNGGATARSLLEKWSHNHPDSLQQSNDEQFYLWKYAICSGNEWCIEYVAKEWLSTYIQNTWENDVLETAIFYIKKMLDTCLSVAGRWKLIWPMTIGALSYKPNLWKRVMEYLMDLNDEIKDPQILEFYNDIILPNLPSLTLDTLPELQDILGYSIYASRDVYQWDLCQLLLNHLYPEDMNILPLLYQSGIIIPPDVYVTHQLEWRMLTSHMYPFKHKRYDDDEKKMTWLWSMFYKQYPIYDAKNHINMCPILEYLQDNQFLEKLPQHIIIALYMNALFFKRLDLLPKILSTEYLEKILAVWKNHPRAWRSTFDNIQQCLARIQHILLVMLNGSQEQLRVYCQDKILQILNLLATSDCTEILDVLFQQNNDMNILKSRFIRQQRNRINEHRRCGRKLIRHWLSQESSRRS